MIKVAIYDDNVGRLDGLEMLINSSTDMVCVGTFENCASVVEDISKTNPDVVLLDIDMPIVNGIEGLKQIREKYPNVKSIIQTVFEDEEKIFDAIHNGAHGYFLKKTDPAKLLEGIRDVLDGGAPMTSSVAKKVLEVFQQQGKDDKNRFDLTKREKNILSLLMMGKSYKMIADECDITWHTVNSHCKKIYEKLHVHSATEAVAKARNMKL